MGGHCPWFDFWKKLRRKQNKESKKESELQVSPVSSARGTTITAEPRKQAPAPEERPDVVINKAKTFTYQELATATEHFGEQNFLGQGGFGPVYKGLLRETGQVVAVKELDKGGFQGEKEFLVEVLMLSLMRHPNLVNLIGYCAEEDHRLLVYEYMPLGSLEDRLFDLPPDMEPLDWNTRMKIAAGAARGLEYLHDKADPPVIYRDLKAANILLGEGFHPKLSDFGLAKFGPTDDKSHVSTRVMGTKGYCAPEYATTGKLTAKSDIFSFGVLLLELITGRAAIDDYHSQERILVDWVRPRFRDRKNLAQLADPGLKGQFSESMLKKALNIAFVCIQENPSVRPAISDVILALDYLNSHPYDPNDPNKARIKSPDGERSPHEKTKMLDEDLDRERAVAEAKMWGETVRGKRQQGAKSSLDEVKRISVEDTAMILNILHLNEFGMVEKAIGSLLSQKLMLQSENGYILFARIDETLI